jgi:amino acid transporter
MDPTASEKIAAFFEKPLDEAIDFNSKSYKNLQIVSLISVLPLFISIVMLLFSRPKKMYVLDYFFDFYRPQYWNQAYLLGALIMAILLIGIDVFGLYLNLQEIKKENRTIHWSLIVTLFIAIAIVLFILIVSFINDIPLF